MGNPLENPANKQTKRETTQANLKKYTKEKRGLDYPLGGRSLDTDNLFSNILHETLNGVLSIPNLPRSKYLEWKIKRAEKRLAKMDEKDATKVAREYSSLVIAAAESGDDTIMDEFEKRSGIDDGNTVEKGQ